MKPALRSKATIVASAALCLTLAACSSGGAAASGDADSSGQVRTVESDFGPVELPVNPQAALGFYTTDIDILITLGIPLAGSQPIRGDGYTEFPAFFPQDALAGIETFANYPEYNVEAVLAADPDLILNGLGYDEETVTKLPDIAPTYSVDAFDGRDWREVFRQTAAALERTDEAEAWFAAYEEKLADVRARIEAAGIEPVVAPLSYWDGNVDISCYGVPCLVFADLGLEISPLTEGDGTQLSLEQLDQLRGIDVAFRSYVPGPQGEADDAATLAELAKNSVWASLPFIAEDAYHRFDMEMFYGSPSGHWAFLEVVEEALLG